MAALVPNAKSPISSLPAMDAMFQTLLTQDNRLLEETQKTAFLALTTYAQQGEQIAAVSRSFADLQSQLSMAAGCRREEKILFHSTIKALTEQISDLNAALQQARKEVYQIADMPAPEEASISSMTDWDHTTSQDSINQICLTVSSLKDHCDTLQASLVHLERKWHKIKKTKATALGYLKAYEDQIPHAEASALQAEAIALEAEARALQADGAIASENSAAAHEESEANRVEILAWDHEAAAKARGGCVASRAAILCKDKAYLICIEHKWVLIASYEFLKTKPYFNELWSNSWAPTHDAHEAALMSYPDKAFWLNNYCGRHVFVAGKTWIDKRSHLAELQKVQAFR